MTIPLETLNATMKGLFPERLGMRLVEATPERVVGEMDVEEGHCTTPGVLHGGAVMGFADTLGAYAALKLPIYPQATISATTRSALLFIHRGPLRQTLAKHPRAQDALEQAHREHLLASSAPTHAHSAPKRSTTNLALNLTNIGERGLIGADRLLVIDQNLCTDCDACVDACQTRHGAPRLQRGRLVGVQRVDALGAQRALDGRAERPARRQ